MRNRPLRVDIKRVHSYKADVNCSESEQAQSPKRLRLVDDGHYCPPCGAGRGRRRLLLLDRRNRVVGRRVLEGHEQLVLGGHDGVAAGVLDEQFARMLRGLPDLQALDLALAVEAGAVGQLHAADDGNQGFLASDDQFQVAFLHFEAPSSVVECSVSPPSRSGRGQNAKSAHVGRLGEITRLSK